MSCSDANLNILQIPHIIEDFPWVMDLTRTVKCPNCEESEIGREMFPGTFGVRARFLYVCRKCGKRWEDR
jgi:DNA-directed RNA polymerase subunit RPC12/RpoP